MCESEGAAAVSERPAGAGAGAAAAAAAAGEGRRRVRHRKKLLYERILKQMEFYFSDANLAKDRFLAQLLARAAGAGEGAAEVPLETFLAFNKIRALTHDTGDIAKAMKHSSLLQLSQDRTKVSRKTPIQTYDADSRTVYVESIPASASREWLERVFRDYGRVTYISLPRYKNSQRIKGYGFIEYSKPEEMKNCLNTFTEMGCKLPTCMPPEELSSIKTFSLEESDAGDRARDGEPPRKKESLEECHPARKGEPPKKKESLEESDVSDPARKGEPTKKKESLESDAGNRGLERKSLKKKESLEESYASDPARKGEPTKKKESLESDAGHPAREGEPPKKKTRKKKSKWRDHDSDESGLKKEDTSFEEDNAPKIEVKSETADETDSEAQSGGGGGGGAGAGEEGKRKKRRRKRGGGGGGGGGEPQPGAEQDASRAALWGLQVLAKAEWKALRNSYLNLQRDRLKQWRRRARDRPAPQHHHRHQPAPPPPESPCGGSEPAEPAPAPPEAGVFVAASLPAPCRDVAATKRELGGGGAAVRHVEVREGQSEAVLRFDSLDAANEWACGWARAPARAARWRVLAPHEQQAHAQRWRRARDKRRQPGGAAAAAACHIRFDEETPPPYAS